MAAAWPDADVNAGVRVLEAEAMQRLHPDTEREREREMREGKKKGKKEVAQRGARASVVCSSELAGAQAAAGEERRAEELGLLQDLGGDGDETGGKNEEKVEAVVGWIGRGSQCGKDKGGGVAMDGMDGWDRRPEN